MAENTDSFEKLVQKLRGVNLPAELLSALGLPSEAVRASAHNAVAQAARAAHDLGALSAAFPASPVGKILSQREEKDVVRMAVDLLFIHMTLREMDAKFYIGLDLYGNHPALIRSHTHAMPVPDADREEIFRYLSAQTCRLAIPWSAHFSHALEGLFEGFPFGGDDHIKVRMSSEDEKAYNEQQVEGAHLENIRIGTVPAVAETRVGGVIDGIRHDEERLKALADKFGTDPTTLSQIIDGSPLMIHGFTGYVFAGLGPADPDKQPACSEKGMMFATYSESETKRLYGDAAQKLGWTVRRFEENLSLFLAYVHTKTSILAGLVSQANEYYSRTVISRIMDHEPEANIPGTPDVPWEILGALDEGGNLRTGHNPMQHQQSVMGIASLPMVIRGVERPTEGLAELTGSVHGKLAGRLWRDTETSEWVIFWAPLDTPPAFAIAHNDHDHCPYCVERMSEDDFVRRFSNDEWLIL